MKRSIKGYYRWIFVLGIFLLLTAMAFSLTGTSGAVAQTSRPTTTTALSPAITSITLTTSASNTPPSTPDPNTTYFDVQIAIQVSGFNLVNKVGQPNVAGEGHIIYYTVQSATLSYLPAYTAEGTYSDGTTSTTHTWRNASANYWTYAAQLVNNNDTPLNPPVYAEIHSYLTRPNAIVTNPTLSSMKITTKSPATPLPSPVPNTAYMDAMISSQIAGFKMVTYNNTPPPNAPNEGHLLYYEFIDPLTVPTWSAFVSGNYSFSTVANPFNWYNAVAGYNAFSIQLVNNNNIPLNPPVYAVIKTNLRPGM